MAFETSVSLTNCDYTYAIHPNIKKYTLRDNTFAQTKVGNQDLTGFKINITDKSGLRLVNIFKNPENKIIQQKFYFLMDSLVEREIFERIEK